MKKITVTATWRSMHDVEVPDDFTDTGSLSDFPADVLEEIDSHTADVLEEIDSHTAELVDWTVRG